MTKLITRKTAIAAIISLTVAYPTIAAVPNTFVAGQAASAAAVNQNFTDLDTRVGALESAATDPAANISINCTADADALKNTTIAEDTTYNITGACNGPVFVEEDNVHLLGGSNASDSIVLPAGLDESAVFAQGAHNLQITNLFLDLTATTTANSTAGIWARNAFVRLRDSRIQGGYDGIHPFRGAIVRLDGTNSITEFTHVGLAANDQSNINTRGPTTVTSTHVVSGTKMFAIAAYNGSSISIGDGITVSVPVNDNSKAVNVDSNAALRIQNSGTVDITGRVGGYNNSTIQIDKGDINGKVEIGSSSSFKMSNVGTVTGKVDSSNNSIVDIDGGTINGNLVVSRSSTLRLRNGVTVNGNAEIGYSSNWRMDGGSISGDIELYRGAAGKFQDVTQASDSFNAVRINENSVLSADNSNLGRFSVFANSTINLKSEDGGTATIKGGEMNLGSVGTIRGVTVTADIALFPSSAIHITNGSDFDGNNLYLCDPDFSSYIDSSVTGIANSTTTSGCRP